MEKRIIVVGINKVGKTSVIEGLVEESNRNSLLNEDVFRQSPGEMLLEREKHKYRFIEIAGLAEAVKSEEDEDYKISLLNNLFELAKCHIDLIIFVMRCGTIHSNDRDMYELVAMVMVKTPKICVVTGCENELDMNQWVKANEIHFTRNHMIFEQVLGTCFGRGGRFEKVFSSLRKESSIHLWNCISSLLNKNASIAEGKSMDIIKTPVINANSQTQANLNNICDENSNKHKHPARRVLEHIRPHLNLQMKPNSSPSHGPPSNRESNNHHSMYNNPFNFGFPSLYPSYFPRN